MVAAHLLRFVSGEAFSKHDDPAQPWWLLGSAENLQLPKRGAGFMDRETTGTVISVAKQWWLKVNTKPVRTNAFDGAAFPHIVKVQYIADGKTYVKRKWIGAGKPVPAVGSSLVVLYRTDKPDKARVL